MEAPLRKVLTGFVMVDDVVGGMVVQMGTPGYHQHHCKDGWLFPDGLFPDWLLAGLHGKFSKWVEFPFIRQKWRTMDVW